MVVPLTDGWAVVVGSLVWAVLGTLTGYVTHRLPVTRFDHDNFLTRLRPRELDGRIYERRLHIRRWKRWLPEAGDAFDGGFSKKHLRSRGDAHLERFVAETRRAEMTHWVVMAFGPLFLLWSPLWLGVIMVLFGVVANLPCLLAQRYNRARLMRVQRSRSTRAARSSGIAPS